MGFIKAFLSFLGMVVIALGVMIFGFPWWGSPKLNRIFIQIFSRYACFVIGAKLTIINEEILYSRRPAVFIGNHQSGLDFAFIGRTSPEYSVIVGKKEIIYIPIFGWFFKLAGNLMIQRSDARTSREQFNELAKKIVARNLTVAVFPEGTRNKESNEVLLPFKKGAFHIAFAQGIPIIPVVCSSLKGKAVWERFELDGGEVLIKVLEPVETRGVPMEQMGEFVERIRSRMQAELDQVNRMVRELEDNA